MTSTNKVSHYSKRCKSDFQERIHTLRKKLLMSQSKLLLRIRCLILNSVRVLHLDSRLSHRKHARKIPRCKIHKKKEIPYIANWKHGGEYGIVIMGYFALK